jgi:ribose transport system substrate-binding protein
MTTRPAATVLSIVTVACTLLVTACGGGSSGAGSTAGGSASSGAGGTNAAADSAAAKALIAPYTGQPSAFPIDTPLTKKPTGKRIAYLDCGTPICGLFYQLATPAIQALGMKLTAIKSGLAADTVQSAFDTVVQDKYDGVFVPAIPSSLWKRGLGQLQAAKIPVVTSGVIGADPAAVPVQQVGTAETNRSGQVLAGQVVAAHGDQANVVFYYTPELDFTNLLKDSFVAEMKTLCSNCRVRTAKISVSTFGTTAPNLIVDDLQANPDTKTAVFGIGEQTPGLPAAMKTAGLTIETIVNSPDPANLEGIQKGDISLGFGLDLPVVAWTAADSLARLTTGQPPAPGAAQDIPPQQFLTKADLKGDVSKGWTGYPDFADRFMKLWAKAI